MSNQTSKPNHHLMGQRVIMTYSASALAYHNGILMGGQLHKGAIYLRGIVEKLDAVGVAINGVRTIKKTDTQSVREFPVDESEKAFFMPWSSVASIQVIEAGSEDEKVDNIILERVKNLQ
jgi:hypothetical protein